MWETVGNEATTQERFREYFKSSKSGYAIEVKNPIRFREPILPEALNGKLGRLVPPQSFIILEPTDSLYAILERERTRALRENPPTVTLRRISADNRDTYRKEVMRYVSPHYEDIDESFAASALKIHDLGCDPTGFFTTSKEVLEIIDRRNRRIGFTTLTYKSGGCVKTGPTILRKTFRGKGFGIATRRAIEEYIRTSNARKVYCTCPETAEQVTRYLLASGMRIEAHLERHYATTHNELVFGKLLVADEPLPFHMKPPASNVPGRICDPASLEREILIADFAKLFRSTWSKVTTSFAKAIVDQALNDRATDQSVKPKRLVCIWHSNHCIAAVALLPKRGGAVKGVLLRGTRHESSLKDLIAASSSVASDLGGRKLYFLHPVLDSIVVAILRSTGFQAEGLLRASYKAGQDAVVMSRFLR